MSAPVATASATLSALALLRAEYAFLRAHQAALRAGGSGLTRSPELAQAMRRAGMDRVGYPRALGQLVAAAPAESREAIKAAFTSLLPEESAATLRGVADGTSYTFDGAADMHGDCWRPDGVYLQTQDGDRHMVAFRFTASTDEAGAVAIIGGLEREARLYGASVAIRCWRAR